MSTVVSKKEVEEFKVLYKVKDVNWCSLVASRSKSHFFIRIFQESLKKNAPNLVHKCPYYGVLEEKNIIFPREFLLIFPDGDFKYNLTLSNGEKKIIEIEYSFQLT